MTIRKGKPEDIDAIVSLEAVCFPPKEAADRDTFVKRLHVYPNHFVLAEEDGKVIGLVNGPVTDEENLIDEMYADTSFHCEKGDWQMIFGVETHPDYQNRHVASKLLDFFIKKAKEEGRKGVVLTCKENLVSFYEKFGFISEGVSSSTHGDVVWYQMRIKF